jgi:hypothetical protein
LIADHHGVHGSQGVGRITARNPRWVLEQFTRWQAVNWDYAGQLQKAQMDVAQVEADRDFRH